MLSHDRLLNVLSYNKDTGEFVWKVDRGGRIKAGDCAGSYDKDGYRKIFIDRQCYRAHRLAYFYMEGVWPNDQIDHINGVKDDNRWCNLRNATRTQNQYNTRKQCNNSSGFKGVTWDRQKCKWKVSIRVNGKKVHFGHFKRLEFAANKAAKVYQQLHRDYAYARPTA